MTTPTPLAPEELPERVNRIMEAARAFAAIHLRVALADVQGRPTIIDTAAEQDKLESIVRAELAAARQEAMPATDDWIDALLANLDQIARDRDVYEYGLPMWGEALDKMRTEVRKSLESAPATQQAAGHAERDAARYRALKHAPTELIRGLIVAAPEHWDGIADAVLAEGESQ